MSTTVAAYPFSCPRCVQEFVGKLLAFGAVHWSPVPPESPHAEHAERQASSLQARERALAAFGPHVSPSQAPLLLQLTLSPVQGYARWRITDSVIVILVPAVFAPSSLQLSLAAASPPCCGSRPLNGTSYARLLRMLLIHLMCWETSGSHLHSPHALHGSDACLACRKGTRRRAGLCKTPSSTGMRMCESICTSSEPPPSTPWTGR